MTPISYEEIFTIVEELPKKYKPALNIGCGPTKDPAYVSVDLYADCDVMADARKLPFDDNSVGHILANNVLEHFTCIEAQDCLEEWKRVLKPGGKLVVCCPSIDVLMEEWAASGKETSTFNDIMGKIYAMHDKAGMGHKWGYTLQSLALAIYGAGFHILQLWQHFPPRPTPNCTVYAVKP